MSHSTTIQPTQPKSAVPKAISAAAAAFISDIGEAMCRGICRAAGKKYIEKGSEEDMERWNKLEDIPSGYREMAQRYIDAGALRGKDGGALDLTEDMLRTMEIMRRYFEGEA